MGLRLKTLGLSILRGSAELEFHQYIHTSACGEVSQR
jgi:hypothetical protein